ncbi:unnamed protein product [Closterium sp. NIES-64]|nr:unnamed protein product [Closterium sp. NIES-64]
MHPLIAAPPPLLSRPPRPYHRGPVALLSCGQPPPLRCGPAALTSRPAAPALAAPATLRRGPAALNIATPPPFDRGPVALRSRPAALTSRTPSLCSCGPAALLSRPRRPELCGVAALFLRGPAALTNSGLRRLHLSGLAAFTYAASPPSPTRPAAHAADCHAARYRSSRVAQQQPPHRRTTEPQCNRAAPPPSRPAPEPPGSRAAPPPSRPAPEPPGTRAALPPSRPGAEPPSSRAAESPSRPPAEPPDLPCPGRAIDFEVWVDDLQLFLQCDRADGLDLFDLTSGASPAPAADADPTVRSQWATRDAAARLAVRRHLPITERAHFSQYKSAQTLYDAIVARYSSPATAGTEPSHATVPLS